MKVVPRLLACASALLVACSSVGDAVVDVSAPLTQPESALHDPVADVYLISNVVGAPAAGQTVLEVGAWNLSTFAAGYLTPVALATHAIALNYASVSYMVPLGVSAAAAVSVGHAIGAGDPARARRAGWRQRSSPSG